LLECITTMVTNLLFAQGGDSDPDGWDYARLEQVQEEIERLIAACARCPAPVVLVTNEVGWGLCRKTVWRGIFAISPGG
jgi:adenosylcobinamide kinase/adenosylcobinamide-phosphate guanylyltransferase